MSYVSAFLSFSGSSLQAPSCERVPTALAGAISSLSSEVVGDCLIRQSIRLALQPTRVARESTPLPEPGVGGGGPSICGEPSASQSHWSELASEGSLPLSALSRVSLSECARAPPLFVSRAPTYLIWVCTFMEDIQKLESSHWREGSRKNLLTHGTWSFTAVTSLFGTCCRDFKSLIKRRQFAWFNQVVFEDLMHVWQRVSRRDDYDETCRKVTRVPSSSAPTWRGGRRMRLLGLRDRWRPRRASASSPHCLGKSYDTRQLGGCRACFRRSGTVLGARAAAESRRPVCFWFCGRRTCSSNSRKRKRPGRERDGKTPATKPGQDSSPASSMPGHFSGPCSHLCGIACWRICRSRS